MSKSIVLEATKLASMWEYKSTGMDNANKNEFDVFYDRVKYKDSREAQVKAHKEASKAIVSETQRRGFVAMLNLAVGYTHVSSVCNYKYIEWDNLKRVVKFHKYIAKHYDEDVLELVLDKLSNVYTKGMSPDRYNNGLTALLDTLKEEYKVEVVTKVTVEEGLVYLDNVGVGVKRAMLDKLMEEFGYEVREVA